MCVYQITLSTIILLLKSKYLKNIQGLLPLIFRGFPVSPPLRWRHSCIFLFRTKIIVNSDVPLIENNNFCLQATCAFGTLVNCYNIALIGRNIYWIREFDLKEKQRNIYFMASQFDEFHVGKRISNNLYVAHNGSCTSAIIAS